MFKRKWMRICTTLLLICTTVLLPLPVFAQAESADAKSSVFPEMNEAAFPDNFYLTT